MAILPWSLIGPFDKSYSLGCKLLGRTGKELSRLGSLLAMQDYFKLTEVGRLTLK